MAVVKAGAGWKEAWETTTMHRIINILFILILATFSCCKENSGMNQDCDFQKSFISLESFIKTQNIDKNDSCTNQLFPQLPAINYDTIKSFSQVDSLKAFICRKKLADLHGIIPLIYNFNNDNIFLSAFPISCNCCADFFINNQMTISLTNKETTFNYFTINMRIDESTLKDTLRKIFNKKLDSFFAEQYEFNKKTKDTIKIKELTKYASKKYRWLIRLALKDDEQLSKIKKPIDMILTSYLNCINESMKKKYKKEMCSLTPFELRLFSSVLFLNFEISKTEK